jgi:hypothetical protein
MTGEIVITALFSASHLSLWDLDELVAQCATLRACKRAFARKRAVCATNDQTDRVVDFLMFLKPCKSTSPGKTGVAPLTIPIRFLLC